MSFNNLSLSVLVVGIGPSFLITFDYFSLICIHHEIQQLYNEFLTGFWESTVFIRNATSTESHIVIYMYPSSSFDLYFTPFRRFCVKCTCTVYTPMLQCRYRRHSTNGKSDMWRIHTCTYDEERKEKEKNVLMRVKCLILLVSQL